MILQSSLKKEGIIHSGKCIIAPSLEENVSWQNGITEKEHQAGNRRSVRELHPPSMWYVVGRVWMGWAL